MANRCNQESRSRQRCQDRRNEGGISGSSGTQDPSERDEALCDIRVDGKQGRHEQQHENKPETEPVAERDHGRLQEACLLGCLVKERREPQHRRERRQQHGPQTVRRGAHDGGGQRPSFRIFVNRRNKHDRIVDDDPGQADQADHREYGQGDIPKHVAMDGAYQTERYDGDNDDGTGPAGEYPCKRQVDADHADRKTEPCVRQEVPLLLGQSGKAGGDAEPLLDFGNDLLLENRRDLLRPARIVLRNVARYRNQPDSVLPPDRREPRALLDLDDVGQGNVFTGDGPHECPFEKVGRELAFGKPDPNLARSGSQRE